MDFDQSYNNGNGDWTFPSPGATPTTGNAHPNVFHTPKTGTLPSHFFQDAFSTPQMPGYPTPQQPDYPTMTPLQGQHVSAEMPPTTYYGHVSSQGSFVNGQAAMPPPNHAGQPGAAFSPAYGHTPVQASPLGAAMSFDSFQMQTPPPTRGTSVKKPTPQQVAFGTPSTIASRRMVTPQQVLRSSQQHQTPIPAPMQFPQLHFSPNVYQFGNLGPASAPVYPQTQLLWEQRPTAATYQPQQMLDDPFAPLSSQDMQWPDALVQQTPIQAIPIDTQSMGRFPVQAPVQRPASAGPGQSQPHLSPPPVINSASVDPSLVYSSPIRPVMPSHTPQSKPRVAQARPEIRRQDTSRSDHRRTSSAESVPASATLEDTHPIVATKTRSALHTTPSESLSRRNSVLQPPRTGSPLKRVGKVPMGSISESKPRRPPSVVLTIDEFGRARTETRRRDPSPTQSIREKYPGLFDSDSSEEESEDDDLIPSRSTSFSFTKRDERLPKAAKLDPPVENLEGLTIPRSSSSTSMKVAPSRAAIAAAAQLRRGGSVRRQTPSRNGSRRVASSAAASIDTCPMDVSAERPYSTVRSRRVSRDQDWSGSTLEAHNRRWSMMSLEQQQSISPTHQLPSNPYQQFGHQQHPRQIRCSCGVADDIGQSLVQCHSCTQWSHAACVGISSPSITFTCFLCTIPTSGLRLSRSGNRTRS